jgi:hypothetical protein
MAPPDSYAYKLGSHHCNLILRVEREWKRVSQDSSSRSEAEIGMVLMDKAPMAMENESRLEDFDEGLLVELRSVKDIISAVTRVMTE